MIFILQKKTFKQPGAVALLFIIFLAFYTANVQAREVMLFDGLMAAPHLDRGLSGKGELLLQPVEHLNGKELRDGLEKYVQFQFVPLQGSEVSGEVSSTALEDSYHLLLQQQLVDHPDWSILVQGGYSVNTGFSNLMEAAILTENRVNTRLTLNNNIHLFYYDNGEQGDRLDNGISYKLDNNHHLRLLVETTTGDNVGARESAIYLGGKTGLSPRTDYIVQLYDMVKDGRLDNNIQLLNQLIYKTGRGLTLNGQFAVNTASEVNNWVSGSLEQQLPAGTTVSCEYFTELNHGGFASLNTRLEKRFVGGLSLIGEYYHEISSNWSRLRAGIGWSL